jgi:hypothetical protein
LPRTTRAGPFGGYQPSEDNLFMTLDLDTVQTADEAR